MKYIILWYNFELLKAGIIINGVHLTQDLDVPGSTTNNY